MTTMKTRHLFSTTIRPAVAVGAALASTGSMAAPPPGQLLSSMCSQCHGTNGQAVSGFESISGKGANDMYKSLLEMSRRRPESIMDLQARAFTPEQLRLIANYLATLPPAGSEAFDD
jgi:cytochrome subunit of sulfide dehydrogenase